MKCVADCYLPLSFLIFSNFIHNESIFHIVLFTVITHKKIHFLLERQHYDLFHAFKSNLQIVITHTRFKNGINMGLSINNVGYGKGGGVIIPLGPDEGIFSASKKVKKYPY